MKAYFTKDKELLFRKANFNIYKKNIRLSLFSAFVFFVVIAVFNVFNSTNLIKFSFLSQVFVIIPALLIAFLLSTKNTFKRYHNSILSGVFGITSFMILLTIHFQYDNKYVFNFYFIILLINTIWAVLFLNIRFAYLKYLLIGVIFIFISSVLINYLSKNFEFNLSHVPQYIFFLIIFISLELFTAYKLEKVSRLHFIEKQRQRINQERIEVQSDLIQQQNLEYVQTISDYSKSEHKLKAIFHNAIISIATLEMDGTINFANEQFQSLTGYTEEELKGKNISDLFVKDESKDKQENLFYESLATIIEAKEVRKSFEIEFIKKDESKIWGQISFSLIYDISPDPEGILCMIIDVSKIKKSEIKLKKAHRELMNANHEVIMNNLELEQQQEEIIEQKEELQKKNEDITASLNYASKIQQSILPQLFKLKRNIKDLFVFYKPKDIVSGDFYWFSKINTQKKFMQPRYKLVLIAADCTGHGVPGAFMTLIGKSYLDEIINVNKILHPALILKELDTRLLDALEKEESEEQIADGMDMSVIVIDQHEKTIDFAGAKNDLLYVRNNEINVIKGTRHSIGGKKYKGERIVKIFKNHIIHYNGGDSFYAATDGYQDQFGGEKDRKFGAKKFRQLLKDIHTLEIDKQKEQLKNTLHNWMGTKYKQIDDILVIGFKTSDISVHDDDSFDLYNWSDRAILVAEDQELSYLTIKRFLRKTKINIIWVRNGLEAVENAHNKDIKVVLMDLDMPVMSGFEAIELIKAQRPNLPIIVQTALNEPEQKNKSFRSGCDDYIAKPINENELLATISKFI